RPSSLPARCAEGSLRLASSTSGCTASRPRTWRALARACSASFGASRPSATRPAITGSSASRPGGRRAGVGAGRSASFNVAPVPENPGAAGSAAILARPAKAPNRRVPMTGPTFQELITRLNAYWAAQGCVLIQPLDLEVGAGTFHPATFLRALGPEPWNAAYVQPSRRPTDGRYGENPNRLQHYYQYQVVMKPNPDNIVELYFGSLKELGIDPLVHDLRLVEDNWESPTLGAWGLGWEVWLNGMEITQFTYFQQAGGLECRPVLGEITYGLERLCMYLQDCDNVYDL